MMLKNLIKNSIGTLRDRFDVMSIRQKLVTFFLLIGLVPLVLGIVVSFLSAFEQQGAAEKRHLEDKALIARLSWRSWEERLQKAARDISHDNTVIINHELGLAQALREHLADLRQRTGADAVLLASREGMVIVSDREIHRGLPMAVLDPGAGPVDPDRVDRVFLHGHTHPYWHDLVEESTQDGFLVYQVSVPLFDYEGVLSAWIVLAQGFPIGDRQAASPILQEIGAAAAAEVYLETAGADGRDTTEVRITNRNGLSLAALPQELGMLDEAGMAPGKTEVHLMTGLPYHFLSERQVSTIVFYALVLGLVVLAAALGGKAMSRILAAPLLAVSQGAREIAAGNYHVRINALYHDEIGTMAQDFNTMASQLQTTMARLELLNNELELRVQKRTEELSFANEALSKSLAHLKSTQDQLLESEKHAALGSMVAGISHELNTPLGSCITALSYMTQLTRDISLETGQNRLTRQGLGTYLDKMMELELLMTTNLNRSVDRINLFSQLNVSEGGGNQEPLALSQFVDDLILGLSVHLPEGDFHLANRIDSGLMVTTSPGLLYQIINRICMNSIQHGFRNRDSGSVVFSVKTHAEFMDLMIEDDGNGIPKAQLPHVMEPFFTTTMGSSQAGLGLSICYNMVTRTLKGKLLIESDEGMGTRVILRLPQSPSALSGDGTQRLPLDQVGPQS